MSPLRAEDDAEPHVARRGRIDEGLLSLHHGIEPLAPEPCNQRIEVFGGDARGVEVRPPLAYGAARWSRAVRLQQLDEAVTQAEASPKGAEAGDTVLVCRLGCEQLHSALLGGALSGSATCRRSTRFSTLLSSSCSLASG